MEKIITGEGEFEGWTFEIYDTADTGRIDDFVVVGALDDDSLAKPYPIVYIKKEILETDFNNAIIRVQKVIAAQIDLDEYPNYEIRVT